MGDVLRYHPARPTSKSLLCPFLKQILLKMTLPVPTTSVESLLLSHEKQLRVPTKKLWSRINSLLHDLGRTTYCAQ